jgi:hypothetical protein
MAGMDEPTKEMWDLSLASDYMGYVLLGGIILLIALLIFHVWSRLLWLICGVSLGAFVGFVIGNYYSVRAVHSKSSG